MFLGQGTAKRKVLRPLFKDINGLWLFSLRLFESPIQIILRFVCLTSSRKRSFRAPNPLASEFLVKNIASEWYYLPPNTDSKFELESPDEFEAELTTNNGDKTSNEATPFELIATTGEPKTDADGHDCYEHVLINDSNQINDDAKIVDSNTKIEAQPMATPNEKVSMEVSKKASSLSTKATKATKAKNATKVPLKKMSVKSMMEAMLSQIKENKDPDSESSSMACVSVCHKLCSLRFYSVFFPTFFISVIRRRRIARRFLRMGCRRPFGNRSRLDCTQNPTYS